MTIINYTKWKKSIIYNFATIKQGYEFVKIQAIIVLLITMTNNNNGG
jgi:hypothetical protein